MGAGNRDPGIVIILAKSLGKLPKFISDPSLNLFLYIYTLCHSLMQMKSQVKKIDMTHF